MPAVSDRPLALAAGTAANLMHGDVASIRHDTPFADALAFLIDHNITAAPVVGEFGEPVGVLSVTDLLIHVRACVSADCNRPVDAAITDRLMTPTVFTVNVDAPAAAVVADLVRTKVHHLFVTDDAGKIVGVISTCDVLRHLE